MSQATKTYAARAKAARDLLRDIALTLDAHGEDQRDEPNNGGFVGDLEHVIAQLENVHAFLAGEGR